MKNPSNTFFSNKIRTSIFQKKGLIIHTFLVAVIDSLIPVVQVSLLGYLVMQMLSGTDAEIMFVLILYLFTFFAQHIAAYFKNRAQLKLKLDFAQIIEEDVIKKVNETSLNNSLESKFHDSLATVQNVLSPGQISNMIVLMIESLIVFLTVTFIMVNLITVNFIAPLIVLMLLVIIFPLQIKANNNYRDRVLLGYAREQNTINTLENDIFSRHGFIEMSIMGYHKWIKKIWLHKFRALRRVRLRESMKLETLNHLLSTTWHLSPPVVAIIVIMNDQISISQFVILFGSMYYLIPRVFSAAELFTRLQESLGLFRK